MKETHYEREEEEEEEEGEEMGHQGRPHMKGRGCCKDNPLGFKHTGVAAARGRKL